jgi:predicted ATPase/class 3 adenylate cyclase
LAAILEPVVTVDAPDVLTFLFTDLESSTRLWERFPDAMKDAMPRHDTILRKAVEDADGRVVKVMGDGLMALFPSPSDAATACLDAQRALHDEPWGETGPLRVRMGVHVGGAQERGGDFFGPTVNRAARIMAAAHGGQVLLSALAAEHAGQRLPAQVALRDLGEHRLQDLFRPEHIFELVDPALPSDFPPLATLSVRPNNLPTQTSEFFGRATELAALRDLLDAAGVRLLTLTGPGGIGKTRLALQAAADQIDRFEDGVYFVDLASVREADAAFEAIGRAIDSTVPGSDSPFDVLKTELKGRRILLVLDNFEQVMSAADGVADLLQQCSQLEVLVTSREALSVRGEHLFPVPPLSLPDIRPQEASAESIAGFEAVRLFVERAREARPSFSLTDENAPAVAESCARLDGLPLAIELAAARLKIFSPDDLRERLGSRLELLRAGPRDLPARQQTLRSTIEWSYELLDADERAVFGLLSLFFPARVQHVEEVATGLPPFQGVDIVDRLASLVDKSLLRSLNGDRPRLWMLETIREYAEERLEQDPELGVRARRTHAEYFADFAKTRREGLAGPTRESTLDDLESELGNLMGAWRYWVEVGDLDRLDSLTEPLWVLHDARGRYHAAVELTDDLLGVLTAAPATPERAMEEITVRTGLARGLLAIRGYTEEVEEAYGRALELSKAAGEVPRRFPVLRGLASFHLYRGEFEKAAAVGRELLSLAEEEDDAGLRIDGHLVLGSSVAFLGEVPAGLDHLERAIALFDPQRHGPGRFRLGPSPGVVSSTTSALLLWLQGYPERAVERGASGIRLAQELNHPFTLAYALFHVGLLDLWRGDFELVYERSSGVLDAAEEHDYQMWRALGFALQGAGMVGLGHPAEGLARHDQGLALYQGLKAPPVFWPILHSMKAAALGLGGRPAEGLALIDEAIELGGEGKIPYPDFTLIRGDLLLAQGERAGAERSYRDSLRAAGALGLRMPQLRAAVRLARISERCAETETLRSVYDTFTEGFDSADLVEARTILDKAGDRVG